MLQVLLFRSPLPSRKKLKIAGARWNPYLTPVLLERSEASQPHSWQGFPRWCYVIYISGRLFLHEAARHYRGRHILKRAMPFNMDLLICVVC